MKELTIEEKAKAYDEAIERAKELLEIGLKDTRDKRVVLSFFPELKESEDERIRKHIIEVLRDHFSGEDTDKCIAWLEKQGEHAKFHNKIQIGDKVTRNEDGVLVNLSQLNRVAKKQGEQKPAVKFESNLLTHERAMEISPFIRSGFENKNEVEPKFKIGDVIVEIKPNGYCQPVRVKYVGKESYSCESDDGKRFLSFPIINQDDYELVEQNPAWSEEDEQYLLVCKNALAKYQVSDKWDANIISRWLENRLKSLKDRYTWKPSDEQITWLYRATDDASKGSRMKQVLENLLSDLKKLKGE